jgi:thiamine pyrophosphate-dependent acetolactate synthase large subunit-like protein
VEREAKSRLDFKNDVTLGCSTAATRRESLNMSIAPPLLKPSLRQLERLAHFFTKHSRIVVVSGAGISTESGVC